MKKRLWHTWEVPIGREKQINGLGTRQDKTWNWIGTCKNIKEKCGWQQQEELRLNQRMKDRNWWNMFMNHYIYNWEGV